MAKIDKLRRESKELDAEIDALYCEIEAAKVHASRAAVKTEFLKFRLAKLMAEIERVTA